MDIMLSPTIPQDTTILQMEWVHSPPMSQDISILQMVISLSHTIPQEPIIQRIDTTHDIISLQETIISLSVQIQTSPLLRHPINSISVTGSMETMGISVSVRAHLSQRS